MGTTFAFERTPVGFKVADEVLALHARARGTSFSPLPLPDESRHRARATAADMEPEPADKGVDNHIPFVNRLALKRDLQPVVDIYNQL